MKPVEAFLMKPGDTRTGKVFDILGDQVLLKVAGSDTNGQLAVMEGRTPPLAGPPLHRHQREDEAFYVLEGEYLFEVDGKQFCGGPGDVAFAPRGTAHTFQNVSDRPGRVAIIVQPASIENFFAELSAACQSMGEPDLSVIVPIFHKFGLELLGPPLSARAGKSQGGH
jgi:quercetin dioxygenase-like cupin family protein